MSDVPETVFSDKNLPPNSQNPNPTFPFGKTLADVLRIMWARKGLAGLLVAATFLLFIMAFLPFAKLFIELFQMVLGASSGTIQPQMGMTEQTPEDFFLGFKIMIFWIPFIGFLASMIYVVWSRASILPNKQVFEGGFKRLSVRALKVLWRTICLIGWMFLMMLGILVFFMIIGFSWGPENFTVQDPENPFLSFPWQVFLLYLVMVILAAGLYFSWVVSLHGEARDFKLPIHTSFSKIIRHLPKALALVFVLTLIFSGWVYGLELYIYFDALEGFPGSNPAPNLKIEEILTTGNIVLYGGLYLVGMIFYTLGGLAIITLGAIYASKLVPELSSETKSST